ncbi:hypothetical protein Vadar_009611 [Vaccinium darrowii]|uniref:Uncharacterized protein n=1 Tax=Vaccinium darrowii TaxID=229202 RepID=A0ACB7XGF1_9ERIC|nr:hypothetical protein Vadar_009611 [Vaccinium darrowii]
MELLHLSTSLHKTPYSSMYPYVPKQFSNPHLFLGLNFPSRLKSNSGHPRFAVCSEKEYSPNGNPFLENREEYGRSREDSEFVEVIGIGSRKDAVLDFCLDSPVLWHSLRFWDIFIEDSVKVQLQQRYPGKDVTPTGFGSSISVAVLLQSCYTCGYCRICFEGRRRQDEVKDLIVNLQDHTNFCIVVDADVLLEKELVTLDEALKTANTAVLMAINGLSILTSESQKKLLDSQHHINGRAQCFRRNENSGEL